MVSDKALRIGAIVAIVAALGVGVVEKGANTEHLSGEDRRYQEAAGYLCGTLRARDAGPSTNTQTRLVTDIADMYGGLSRPRLVLEAAEFCPNHVVP